MCVFIWIYALTFTVCLELDRLYYRLDLCLKYAVDTRFVYQYF